MEFTYPECEPSLTRAGAPIRLWERSLEGTVIHMTPEPFVRRYRPGDRSALYEICVRTGETGGDARHLYADHDLLPDVFAGPYAALEPELSFVLDDGEDRPAGYVLGTADTPLFVRRFREEWLPTVADRHQGGAQGFVPPAGAPASP